MAKYNLNIMSTPILTAIKQICSEKNISMEAVLETIESALAAAYRKDFGNKMQNIKVKFNAESGQFKVYDVKTVVEDVELEELEEEGEKGEKEPLGEKSKEEKPKEEKEKKEEKEGEKKEEASKEQAEEDEEEDKKRFNPKTEIMISDALDIKNDAELGEEMKTELEVPAAFGRMAAQTAKQVIIQKLREAERTSLYDEYKDRQGEVMTGVVQRREGRNILVDLGRINAILPMEEQIEGEKYNIGSRIKVYVISVSSTTKGPEVIVSRTHPEILKKLFVLEIPEIASGSVEIRSISREAGSRSKVAVEAMQDNIDPIGSCVGQRGARIQTIISELGGEKVDIIEYSDDPAQFITNALSPAKVLEIKVNEEDKTAMATVKDDQLSLAIGKAGQNVRLAAKLTGWKINISVEGKGEVEVGKKAKPENEGEPKDAEAEAKEGSAEGEKGEVDGSAEMKAEDADEKTAKLEMKDAEEVSAQDKPAEKEEGSEKADE